MTVEVTRLPNGVTVATHDMPHLESVALGVWIGTGARSETPLEHGISHLLEHMAFKGTQRRTARDIAEAVERVGGEINAETSVDSTTYYMRLLKEDVALGLDVLGDIICDPLLDEDELSTERHVILQEIGAVLDVPEDRVFDMFQEAAFPEQAIGRSILGTPDSIKRHTPEDLRRFLHSHYRGPKVVVSAAGNLDHDQVARLAEEHLGVLSGEPPTSPEPGSYAGGERREPRRVNEAQILLGFAGPSFTDGRFAATHILSAILGGGMASRLFQELRENRGLCYSISSFYWPFADTGLFGIQTATSEADVGELVPLVLDELRKITEGVTDAELARAKAQLRAGLLMTLESPIARAGQMARHILVHGRPLTLEEAVEKVEAVSAADLSSLAHSVLQSPPTLAAIGPLGDLPDVGAIAAKLNGHGAGARV
jgi:predicted Zn-dependent peptidase